MHKVLFICLFMAFTGQSFGQTMYCPKEFIPPATTNDDEMLISYADYNESIKNTQYISTPPDVNRKITTYSQLQDMITKNSHSSIPTLVFVSADWNIGSRVMSNGVFKDQKVLSLLKGIDKVDIDVTSNNDSEIYKAHGFIDPPAVIYYSETGELKGGIFNKCIEVNELAHWLQRIK